MAKKGLLDRIVDDIFDALWTDEVTGAYGEWLTGNELRRLSFLLGDGRVLRNLYVPTADGRTSEVDLVFVTARGVFVIESKNYSGWIFGNEAHREWTQSLPGGKKNRFYNPIRQNRGHMRWLREYLGADVPLWSVIVFSERCELKSVTVTSADVRVVKRGDLEAAVRGLWDAAPERLDAARARDVHRQLKRLTHASKATKKEHVAQIERQLADERAARAESPAPARPIVEADKGTTEPPAGEGPAAEPGPEPEPEPKPASEPETVLEPASAPEPEPAPEPAVPPVAQDAPAPSAAPEAEAAGPEPTEPEPVAETAAPAPAAAGPDSEPKAAKPADGPDGPGESTPTCPRCGKPLVPRLAKRGPHAGERFWGCPGYPSCKYIAPM